MLLLPCMKSDERDAGTGDPLRTRLAWALAFTGEDLRKATPAALKQWAHDVLRSRQDEASGVHDGPDISGMSFEVFKDRDTFPHYTLRALRPLQREVQRGMNALDRGKPWKLPQLPTVVGLVPAKNDFAERHAGRADKSSRYVVRRYHGSFEATFFAGIADAILAGWSDVRRCAAPTCTRRFLPTHGRQRWCEPRCGSEVRWAKFAPKRKRDYRREYQQRIDKQLGGRKAKVRHRGK